MSSRLPVFLIAAFILLGGCTAADQVTEEVSSGEEEETPYEQFLEGIDDTDDGLFTIHQTSDELYYEIPDSLLGAELLMVSRIARTATNIGYGGERANNQVLRWQRNGDEVLLRRVSYENVADENEPIYEAVRNANFEPIIMSFDIETESDEGSVVIDVTQLFTSDVPTLGLQQQRREAYQVRQLDSDRTFLNSAKSFPKNIEVRTVLTYTAQSPPSNQSTNAISLEMNHSMVLLPEDKMQPRLCDDRVGYFSVEQVDYGLETHRASERCFITRWRLEPTDEEAYARGELVEPKDPIVFYIDPATPERYREYLKQGVDDWQVAFERAGFKNAIYAKDPPTAEEDPEFSPEDVRYSVIRYFPSETMNAYGPHVHDPRTGEILESHIGWYHNVTRLLRNWYFTQTAAVNPSARHVQFDEEVMGELVRFVSAHEVGHTLGLPHNWGSSHAVPVDSLRSPTYTAEHGTAASIMDYARFNYIAQPGDGVTNFDPAIGEYDKWSIKWGYSYLPEYNSSDAERSTLNEWIVERADDPRYFYGRANFMGADPRSQREALGDDNMYASELGIANLERIVPNLIQWTNRPGEDFEELDELYGNVVAQWNRYLGHVTTNVGGVHETPRTYEQEGPVYEVVDADQQRRAMAFLDEYAFQTPEWLLEDDVLRRIENSGSVERIRTAQVGTINSLLNPSRIARMIEAEEAYGDDVYSSLEMLADLRHSVWKEIENGESIDTYRRHLQRGYLDRMNYLMNEEPDMPSRAVMSNFGITPVEISQSDIRAYVRGELKDLQQAIDAALNGGQVADRRTQLHLEDAQVRIQRILDEDAN